MPVFEMFTERNARQGFVEPADLERIVVGLPERLQDFTRFAYASGWRKNVDRGNGRVVLRPEHSKNGEGSSTTLGGRR